MTPPTFCLPIFKLMSAPTTDADGNTTWRDDSGEIHRVWQDGSRFWYQHGRFHRDGDLPAVVWPDGSQVWCKHGKRHRDGDLPAAVWANGTQNWYRHGERHRDGDLPAVVYADGRQAWWVDGRLQSDRDRAQTREAMAVGRRWSPLRAAFVGAVVVVCIPRGS